MSTTPAHADIAAAMLHKTIVDTQQDKLSVDEHLKLYQKCRMAVGWWAEVPVSHLDTHLETIATNWEKKAALRSEGKTANNSRSSGRRIVGRG